MIASISLDLDNKWSYMKTHGDAGWDTFPSYLDRVVPRILEFLDERGVKITFFVVGKDAALEKNKAAIRSIADAGHEIANHSFMHEPWLHLYTPSQLQNEFEKTEQVLSSVTGQVPVGFRGPGFSLSQQVLRTLVARGYEYDCSTFPTFLGPVARGYYFLKSGLNRQQKEDRKELFGRLGDGFQSLRPYHWKLDGGQKLVELPVTTMPLAKTPIHLSYLLYLSSFSRLAARTYFWKAMKMCRMLHVEPSVLLHPLDFLGSDDEPDLAYFPGMKLPASRKLKVLAQTLSCLSKNFELVNMRQHASLAANRRLPFRGVESARMGIPEPVQTAKVRAAG